jgi:hypothetical protein
MQTISTREQAGVIREASLIGLDGYGPGQHVDQITLYAAVDLIKTLHDAGYVIAKA